MNKMNNRILRLAAFGLMLVAIAACTKTDINTNDDLANGLNPSSGAPIAFVSQDAFTKAEGDTDPEAFMAVRAGGFKVWSWFKGTTEGPMFGENGTEVKDDNYVADLPEGQTQPDQNWTYSPLRYWLNGTYDFAAVYPKSATGTYARPQNSSTSVLTVTGFDVTNQDDLLVAFNTGVDGGKGNANGPVQLTFKHALSCVQLQLKLNRDSFYPGGAAVPIAEAFVSIAGFNNVYSKANLTASQSSNGDISLSWNDHSNRSSFGQSFENPLLIGNDYVNVFSGDGIHVMPQSLEDNAGEFYLQVRVKFIGSGEEFVNEFTVPLNSGVNTWLPNTKYIYKGEVTQDSAIKFTVVRVNDWDKETLDDFIVGTN